MKICSRKKEWRDPTKIPVARILQKWKEGKTRYSQDDSIWGKEAMAKLYRELFAGNPGVLEKELVALEKPAVVATAVVL